jgi:ribosomal protein L37AE/L43A
MQESKVIPMQYNVFNCPKCGKWAYAKQSMKVLKCGFCRANIQILGIPTIVVEKVTNAHKLVQEKNLTWQQQKGLKVSEFPTPKPVLVNKFKSLEPSFEFENYSKQFEVIFRKIIQICTSRAMPLHALSISYFAALYLSLERIIPFSQFLRFCSQMGWVDHNHHQNLVTIKLKP